MKTEEEIRKQLEDFTNAEQNLRFLAEKTGQDKFLNLAIENDIAKNTLRWVLDEFEFKEKQIIMDMRGEKHDP